MNGATKVALPFSKPHKAIFPNRNAVSVTKGWRNFASDNRILMLCFVALQT
jgi:hypothetical protein